MKRRIFGSSAAVAMAVILAGSAITARADDGNTDRNNQFDFALVGDVPYSPTHVPSGTTIFGNYQTYPSIEYEKMIADINAHNKVLFTVHMGDIKEGNTQCQGGNPSKDLLSVPDPVNPLQTIPANVYAKNLEYFNSYRNAAIYLPGDNEWTDCHRLTNGSYNPTERLAYIRGAAGFFATNLSLGQHPITLQRQSSDPAYGLYKENVMWRTGNVIFVGLNQPGSNNNHGRTSGVGSGETEGEYAARNTANIAWLNKAFDMANSDTNTKAIVIMQQANVFERFLEASAAGVPLYARSGYEDFVRVLRNRTIEFEKPVVLVGGDTHTVRIDKPLLAIRKADGTYFKDLNNNTFGYPSHTTSATNAVTTPTSLFDTTTGAFCPPPPTPINPSCAVASRVQNFTRVEVFGSPDVAWIRAVVDPFDPNVLSFSMQTIAGNGHGRDGRGNQDDDDQQ